MSGVCRGPGHARCSNTSPSLITVHGVVSPDDGSEFTVPEFLGEFFELFEVDSSGAGCSVTTVAQEMDVGVWDALLFGGFGEGKEMCDV